MPLRASLLLLTLWAYVQVFAQTKSERIPVGPGTEDIVLDTLSGSARLLVSCNQRRDGLPYFGEIVAVSLTDNSKDTLTRTGEPADLKFNPHGIDLVAVPNGKPLLFVVNHETVGNKSQRNSILVYEVDGSALLFKKQHVNPFIVSPNDVAGMADGSFYATNDTKHKRIGFGWLMEKMFKVRSSRIVYCTDAGQCLNANDKKLAYANGVLIQGDKVYVATTQRKTLAEYHRQADGSLKYVRNIARLNGLDNISLINTEHVLVAAHPKPMRFLKHARNPQKLSPGIVYLIKLDAEGVNETLYVTDGSEISGNSVAVGYGQYLYIGQVFEDWILKVTVEEGSATN